MRLPVRLGRLTIARRLQFGLGSILLFMVLLTLAGIWGMTVISNRLSEITDVNNAKIALAETMRNASGRIDKSLLVSLVAKDEGTTKDELAKVQKARGDFSDAMQKMEKLETSKAGRELVVACKENFTIAQQANDTLVALLAKGDVNQAAMTALGSVQVSAILEKACSELVDFQQKKTLQGAKGARSSYITAASVLFIFAACVIAFAAGLSYFLKKSITKPLSKGVFLAQRIGDGALGIEIGAIPEDETGDLLRAIKTMAERLREIIGQAQSVASDMASASRQLNGSSEQMSQGASEQASRASQVAAASEEMSQTVLDVARNATTIEVSAVETVNLAKAGETAVERSVEKVRTLATAIDESGELIRLLGDRSDQIGAILNVINDIADQTNLLALNAAIEAARAGEAGRGFAVVADEVRKLAERTSSSTSEIGTMIKSIQDHVSRAVSSMEGMTKEVKSGVELSTQGSGHLHRIVESIDQLHLQTQQIASATEEMATTSEEISRDIESIASISARTSDVSGDIAQASRQLARLSADLDQVVSGFTV
jgi:methyl-accepting chemotaxis protein